MKTFLIAASAVVVLLYLGKKASAESSAPDQLPPVGSVGEKVKVGDVVVLDGRADGVPAGASQVLLQVQSADSTNVSGPIVGYRDGTGRSFALKPSDPLTIRRSSIVEIAGNVPIDPKNLPDGVKAAQATPRDGVKAAQATPRDGDKVVVNGVTYPVLQAGDPLLVATGTPYTNADNQMKVPLAAVERVIPRGS